jgi:hypothetical protein
MMASNAGNTSTKTFQALQEISEISVGPQYDW